MKDSKLHVTIDVRLDNDVKTAIDAAANSAFRHGIDVERERIVEMLSERFHDLSTCGKPDECHIWAKAVRVCIDDIVEDEDDVTIPVWHYVDKLRAGSHCVCGGACHV